MDLGRILLGAAFVAMGYSTLSKGAEHVSKGLSGGSKRRNRRPLGRVERDPGPRSWGKPMGRVENAGGKVALYEVRTLDDRVAALRQRVAHGKVDPTVIAWARRQVTGKCASKPGGWCVAEKDTVGEIRAIFDAIRRDVRYTSDPSGVDTYGTPRRTLAQRAGDCLPGETALLTPRGFVPIADVRPGDTIHDGTDWVQVLNWWDKGVLPVRSLRLNNNSVLRCTDEHKVFRITRKNGEHVEAPAGSIEEGDQLLQPRAFAAGRESLSAAHAIVVGAYLAEGWYDDSKGVFCIAGIPNSKGVRELVLECLPSLGINPSDIYHHDRYLAFRKEHSWLVSGLGKGAAQKQLPHLDFDLDTVRAIVRVMEMGDGGLSSMKPNGAGGKNMVYSTASKTLALQYRVLQRMLGRSTHMKFMTAEEHGGAGTLPIWRVTVRVSHKKRPWAIVKEVRPNVEATHVYDIETSSGRIYLPESDIIVHNCDDLSTLACSALLAVGIPCRFKVVQTRDANSWSHIYVLAGTPKGSPTTWIPLDPSVPVRAGWEVPPSHVVASRVFEVR